MRHSVNSHNFRRSKTAWSVLVLTLSLALVDRPGVEAAPKQKGQSDLCLDPSVIQAAAKSDGITDPSNPDRNAKSLTSTNNFIDFCKGARLTNGAQVKEGSCNPTPMGLIPSDTNMPSVRINSPSEDTAIAPNTAFDVEIAAHKIQLGFFTSPTNTYYLAPQQLNKQGLIKGHLHVVIQKVNGKRIFEANDHVFFKGVSDKLVNGLVKTTVTGGLPEGLYRISTITSAMNHQPVNLPIAVRGAVEDAIYVRVGSKGSSSGKSGGNDHTSDVSGSSSTTTNDVAGGGGGSKSKTGGKKSKKVCRVKKRKV